MTKNFTKDFSLISIKEAVSGFEINSNAYVDAVKNADIPDIEDIISNPTDYKEYFDGKGEVHTQYLQARLFVLSGKMADNLYKFGGDLNYIEAKKKFREFGYDSMNALFDDTDLPFKKTRCYQAMKINKRFRRNDVIGLGSKVIYLLDLPEEIDSVEIGKIAKEIRNMDVASAEKFIKSGDYKHFLAGEQPPELDNIPLSGSADKHEYIQLNIKLPSLKSSGRPNGIAHLNFENNDYRDISLLIIREWMKSGDFKRRLNDKLNQPENVRYLKRLRKLDESNK